MLPVGRPEKPPLVEVVPPADDYRAGLEAVQIAELAGLQLDDWQVFSLVVALGRREGVWAAFEVALVIARQNGKSELLIAVILWALFTELEDPRLAIFAAHEYKTAREIFLRLRFFLDPPADGDPLLHADPVLLEQVKTVRTANGEESIELHNGRRVRFLARTSGSGRGFTGDVVLLDEAYKLNQEQMAALLPTMGARPNPQIWYASMGPFEDSEVQLSVMQRAQDGDSGLCYLGWEAPPGVDPSDEEWWVKCNPAHPHRMSLTTLGNEFRALGPEGFAREKLCMVTSSVERVIPEILWNAVLDGSVEPEPVAFALDVNPERTRASIAVSDGDSAEVGDYMTNSTEKVVKRVVELASAHSAPVAVEPGGPAGSYIQPLVEAGVTVVEVKGQEYARACGRLFDKVAHRKLRVRTRPELDTAVARAERRTSGEAWAWGRMKSTVDISPLVALTLAVEAASQPVEEDPGLLVYTLDDF